MILVVGLGNPGTLYDATPHNLGFRGLDLLAKGMETQGFSLEKRFNALVSVVRFGREKMILAKPQTMMNRSGDAVRAIARFYRIETEKIWVFHDDLDLPPGTFRHSFNSRAAGHRGVQSIIDSFGSQRFHRIRIGIGRPERLAAEIFVLRPMSKMLARETKRTLSDAVNDFSPLLSETLPRHEMEKGSRHHQPPRRPMDK